MDQVAGLSQTEWNALPPVIRIHIKMQERRIAALEAKNAVLEVQNNAFKAQVSQLTARVMKLEAQRIKNSSNSHQPPSNDAPSKPLRTQSERQGSEKKPGGQEGHSGHT
jgi:hypothetical protein